jgi:hypothetical protein
VFVHSQFFHRPEDARSADLKRYLGEGIPSLDVQTLLKTKPDYFSNQPGRLERVMKYTHIVSSLSLLGILLALEVGLIVLVVDCIEGVHEDDVLYLSIFYMAALPVFLIFGIIFSASPIKITDKFWAGPVIGYALPVLIVEPICYWMYQNDSSALIAIVVSIGFPASVAYWLLMSVLHRYNQRRYQLFSAFCCMGILVPIGYLLPFNSVGTMKSTTFWVFFGLLCM